MKGRGFTMSKLWRKDEDCIKNALIKASISPMDESIYEKLASRWGNVFRECRLLTLDTRINVQAFLEHLGFTVMPEINNVYYHDDVAGRKIYALVFYPGVYGTNEIEQPFVILKVRNKNSDNLEPVCRKRQFRYYGFVNIYDCIIPMDKLALFMDILPRVDYSMSFELFKR